MSRSSVFKRLRKTCTLKDEAYCRGLPMKDKNAGLRKEVKKPKVKSHYTHCQVRFCPRLKVFSGHGMDVLRKKELNDEN